MTVKLTADKLLTAMTTVSTILRERRPMPQRGKFAFAKLHTALMDPFNEWSGKRDELIAAYGHKEKLRRPAIAGQDSEEDVKRGYSERTSTEFSVPEDKLKDFEEKWKILGEEEIELDVKPISVKLFDLGTGTDGSVEGAEIIDMGALITE